MRVILITQARMSSTRLPGKVLKEVLEKPLLEHHIDRLRQVQNAADVVVATTVNSSDDAVVNLCSKINCAVYRGSEEDVLGRYYETARTHDADAVIRVTADCPIIDPKVIERVVQFYIDHTAQYDYVSNTVTRTYPRGMDTEVFSYRALQEAYREAILPGEREHVTPFLYRRPLRYRIGNVTYHTDVSQHRWTVDTYEDFELVRKIIEALEPEDVRFSLEDVLALLERHKSWTRINGHVPQKHFDEAGGYRECFDSR